MGVLTWLVGEGGAATAPPPPPPPRPQLPPPSNTYTYVLGGKGQGKTLYAKACYLERMRAGGRGVILDPNGVFGGFGEERTVRDAVAFLSSPGAQTRRFSIVVRPAWGEKCSDVFRAVFACGRLLLLVDEAERWGSSGRLDSEFRELMQVGRNRYVDVITTSQGPKSLHPRIKMLWDVLVTFKQGLPDHADELAREYFGRADLAPAISNLPKLHGLRVNQRGEITRVIAPLPTG